MDGGQTPLGGFEIYLTMEEKAAMVRAELYHTHKVRGSLGTYYDLFPDERPACAMRQVQQDDQSRNR